MSPKEEQVPLQEEQVPLQGEQVPHVPQVQHKIAQVPNKEAPVPQKEVLASQSSNDAFYRGTSVPPEVFCASPRQGHREALYDSSNCIPLLTAVARQCMADMS